MVRPSSGLFEKSSMIGIFLVLKLKPRLGLLKNFCRSAPNLSMILFNDYDWFKPMLSTNLPRAVYLDQRRQLTLEVKEQLVRRKLNSQKLR